jgi:CMP-N-acetylneuraminic acid synthetase
MFREGGREAPSNRGPFDGGSRKRARTRGVVVLSAPRAANMQHVLAIIPARSGSKGIPRKNLAAFRGVPLLVHSIRHALAARRVTRTVVSTDDPEIAAVAIEHGAEVPFLRPAELAADDVLDFPVFQHVLAELAAREGYRPEVVVHLRPTTPVRRPEWLDQAVGLLEAHVEADSVRSVSRPAAHPYRMFRIGADGFLVPLMRQEHATPYLLRRQDLPPVYHYNCVLDVTRYRTILEQGSMTGERILPFIMAPEDVVDIDSPRDLELARLLFP